MMEGKIYGYIRISSKDQNEERQLIALRSKGVMDKISSLTRSPVRILTAHNTKSWSKR